METTAISQLIFETMWVQRLSNSASSAMIFSRGRKAAIYHCVYKCSSIIPSPLPPILFSTLKHHISKNKTSNTELSCNSPHR
jgi:hypothetical protein